MSSINAVVNCPVCKTKVGIELINRTPVAATVYECPECLSRMLVSFDVQRVTGSTDIARMLLRRHDVNYNGRTESAAARSN